MRKIRLGWRTLVGMMTLVLVLSVGLFVDAFAIVSHAESAGKVTAETAKIRKEASTSSDVMGSAAKDDKISIIGKTTGSDGMTWYQIYVDANTKGFIRSDLAEVTDGSTPATLSSSSTTSNNTTTTNTNTSTTTTTTQTPAPVVNETPVAVTEVEPISANVTGGSAVRVRSNASTTSSIVTTAQSGIALTVTGTATGTDGNTWYRVNFIANGTEVVGFIRNDYVTLAGELVVPSDEPAPETTQPEAPVVEETKDWDTQLDGDKWYLVDNAAGKRYVIEDMFNAVEANKTLYEESLDKIKSQKVTVIILVIVLVVALGAIALLIFRIKDMLDEAYFEEVEKETYRKRGNGGTSSSGRSSRRVMQTVGEEQPVRQRPAQRPAGQAQAGTRPAQRPAGQTPAGTRPAQRPAGQAPAGARPAQRPAGQTPAGARPAQRPAGQTPAGVRPAQRPAGQAPAGARPAQRPVGQTPAGNRPAQRPVQQADNGASNPGWKAKNFMADEDEFEFEFLNWEGDEE